MDKIFNWREHLRVHPAAKLFPRMSEAELKELSEDIKANGLRVPIGIWSDSKEKQWLIDGRNRLDALAAAGLLRLSEGGGLCLPGPAIEQHYSWPRHDPYELALSLNVHRRHLTAEQKREAIAVILKARPGLSDRQIAKSTKADHKTVAAVRQEKEACGEIPHVEKRTDSKGRKQPAKKTTTKKTTAKSSTRADLKASAEDPTVDGGDDAEVTAERRKAEYAAGTTGFLAGLGGPERAFPTAPLLFDGSDDAECDTPQDFWRRSITNMAGEAVSLPAYWRKNFPGWEKFEVPSDIRTLAMQAAEAWAEIASIVSTSPTPNQKVLDAKRAAKDAKRAILEAKRAAKAEAERVIAADPGMSQERVKECVALAVHSIPDDLSIPPFMDRREQMAAAADEME
jgi:hypothetical protein